MPGVSGRYAPPGRPRGTGARFAASRDPAAATPRQDGPAPPEAPVPGDAGPAHARPVRNSPEIRSGSRARRTASALVFTPSLELAKVIAHAVHRLALPRGDLLVPQAPEPLQHLPLALAQLRRPRRRPGSSPPQAIARSPGEATRPRTPEMPLPPPRRPRAPGSTAARRGFRRTGAETPPDVRPPPATRLPAVPEPSTAPGPASAFAASPARPPPCAVGRRSAAPHRAARPSSRGRDRQPTTASAPTGTRKARRPPPVPAHDRRCCRESNYATPDFNLLSAYGSSRVIGARETGFYWTNMGFIQE